MKLLRHRQEEAARFRRLIDRSKAKWAAPRDAERLLAELEAKARRLPLTAGRDPVLALWLKAPAAGPVVTPRQVLDVLR